MSNAALLLLACTKDQTTDTGFEESLVPTDPVEGAEIFATGRYEDSRMHDVKIIGDVNGDGYNDVLITESLLTQDPQSGNLQGTYSYIVFGGERFRQTQSSSDTGDLDTDFPIDTADTADTGRVATASSAEIDLPVELVDGEAMILVTSDRNDLAGWSSTGLGDVDGDGIDDLAVAAPAADAEELDQGAVYLVLGDTAWQPSSSETTFETAGLTLTLPEEGARLGSIIKSVGDLNNDGVNELLVVAHYEDQNLPSSVMAPSQNTKAYVIDVVDALNQSDTTVDVRDVTLFTIDFGSMISNADIQFSTASDTLDPYGPALSFTSGDSNADGITEILVGDPTADSPTGLNLAGQVYRFEWDGSTTELTPADASAYYYIDQEGAFLGTDVLMGPDLNQDGYEDVFIASAGVETDLNKHGTRNLGGMFAFNGAATATSGAIYIYDYDFSVIGGWNPYLDNSYSWADYRFATGETDALVIGINSVSSSKGSTWVIPAMSSGYVGSWNIRDIYQTKFSNDYYGAGQSPAVGNIDGNSNQEVCFGSAYENDYSGSYAEAGAIYCAFNEL